MAEDPVQVVIGYHDATKHHPHRYARSLGYLDWASQPNPFRRFSGSPLIHMPIPSEGDSPSYDDMFAAGTIAAQPLTLHSISTVFYLSLALSAWKQAGGSRWSLRCNPSSGNLHPTEGYAVLPAIPGIQDTPAVYHYAPHEHGLELRCSLSADAFATLSQPFPAESWFVGLTSVHWREAWKYGERAYRYCNHDVGHALAALRFATAAAGWRMIVLDNLADSDVGKVLGLSRSTDFNEAEPEQPDMLAVVFPTHATGQVPLGLSDGAIEAVSAGTWVGKANALSSDHVEWNIIDAVTEAAAKPRTATPPFKVDSTAGKSSYSGQRRSSPAGEIIRTRRSALAFDGRTSIPESTFFGMLQRVMPNTNVPPWDAVSWAPRIHLFLFVHLVDGLSPGIYALIRVPRQLDAVRQATDPQFTWDMPANCPSTLPLYLLVSADCRRVAAQLSLGQDIAGTSAFSLGMVSEFEHAVSRPWCYPRLFWEAGIVGQVLYLEAEAAGFRATGIGAYFDDLVHDMLGLTGHGFQSLYHFTIGGPVEDNRIMNTPAYPSVLAK